MTGASDLPSVPEIRPVETERDVAACFPLMRQLRPHLGSEDEFVTRWRRQSAAGYRLIALWRADAPVALAGFRVQENLVMAFICMSTISSRTRALAVPATAA